MTKTKVWAHRGASGWDRQYAPENTLPAFERAAAMGADGIELDVQLTRDGEIVIAHDEKIDRVSDGSGWLKNYTLAELKHLSFSKTHPEAGFVEIPTLAELFAFMQTNGLEMNIELKTGKICYAGLEEKTAALAAKYGMEERIIYSSFNHYSVTKMRQLAPASRIGLLYAEDFVDIPAYPQALGAAAMHPSWALVQRQPQLIPSAHAAGLAVHVWTTDVKLDMVHLIDLGADAFITDCPDSGRRVADGDRSWLK